MASLQRNSRTKERSTAPPSAMRAYGVGPRPCIRMHRCFGTLPPMPPPRVRAFTLTPHPATPSRAVRAIGGRVSPVPGGMLLSYVLEGDLERLRVPEPRPPRFADELWRHTCCEAFVARGGERGYVELNFAPSSEWAVYRFKGLRERSTFEPGVDWGALDPHVTVCRSPGKLELDAVMRLDRLVSGGAAGLKLGISAVVEDRDGALSYWALRHPLVEPDFHHPETFALELDEVRD